jgi:hypothetical protein
MLRTAEAEAGRRRNFDMDLRCVGSLAVFPERGVQGRVREPRRIGGFRWAPTPPRSAVLGNDVGMVLDHHEVGACTERQQKVELPLVA